MTLQCLLSVFRSLQKKLQEIQSKQTDAIVCAYYSELPHTVCQEKPSPSWANVQRVTLRKMQKVFFNVKNAKMPNIRSHLSCDTLHSGGHSIATALEPPFRHYLSCFVSMLFARFACSSLLLLGVMWKRSESCRRRQENSAASIFRLIGCIAVKENNSVPENIDLSPSIEPPFAQWPSDRCPLR
jgi:hypothetical protein